MHTIEDQGEKTYHPDYQARSDEVQPEVFVLPGSQREMMEWMSRLIKWPVEPVLVMKTFTVRFTGEENAALRRDAKKNGVSVSEEVRTLLNPWFQKQKKE